MLFIFYVILCPAGLELADCLYQKPDILHEETYLDVESCYSRYKLFYSVGPDKPVPDGYRLGVACLKDGLPVWPNGSAKSFRDAS
jgi:hypothetical protein